MNTSISMDDLENQARDFFLAGGEAHDLLVNAWNSLPPDARLTYPEVAYQTSKILGDRGAYAAARVPLEVCQKAWANAPELLARAYLQQAQLALREQDLDRLRYALARVQENSTLLVHRAECAFLHGEAAREDDPAAALQHYEQARRLFLQRIEVPLAERAYDVTRACLRAAATAFEQNLRLAGWRHQCEAEDYAGLTGNQDLVARVLLQASEVCAEEGQFEKAMGYLLDAEALTKEAYLREQVRLNSAQIALWVGDEATLRRALENPPSTGHLHSLYAHLLLSGWAAAFRQDFSMATLKLRELQSVAYQDVRLSPEVGLLQLFIETQKGDQRADYGVSVVESWQAQGRFLGLSQARLLKAWQAALARDWETVQTTIHILEKETLLQGQVTHLARLYQLSLPLLGGWWSPDTREKLEVAIKEQGALQGVRVYAFGGPRVYLPNGTLLQQRDRYGQMGMQLLLYMLEQRRAQIGEILAALYPETDPARARERFHTVMTSFRRALQVRDWCTYDEPSQHYVVAPDFPHYYDGDDFDNTYRQFFETQQPLQRLALCFKLMSLYNSFARSVESEFVEDVRRQYQARFEAVMLSTQELLPELEPQLPETWYQKLMVQLDEALSLP
ncbi:MAG: hypothetical protein HC915_01270 [Anaerolineae bacterium]|nr:hypothetical protein [Anaerolineae bacterium]